MLVFGTVPSWVLPGAKFDLDFANGRYWGGNVALAPSTTSANTIQSLVNGPSNGIPGYAPDRDGIIQTFPAYTPRITRGKGLWTEGRYTNYALWCRDFTNAAWTRTNITALKNQAGADNAANAASLLTATASNGTALQAMTQASTTFIGSAYVKRITGTGTISMTIDGGSTYTDITSSINSSVYSRVSVAAQTLTNPSIGFKIGTSGDAIAVDFCQCENNAYPTTPLVTTSAAVARGTDEPALSDPGGSHIGDGVRIVRSIICTGGPWSIYCAGSGNTGAGFNTLLSDGGFTFKLGTSGEATTMRGATGGNTATSANSGNFGLDNINKACGRVSGANNAVCLNGGAIAYASAGGTIFTAQSTAFTHVGLGNNGSGAMPIDGYICRLTFWDHEITDGQMIEFTR